MKWGILFSWKNKKNIINLSSAEFAQRVVKVEYSETLILVLPDPRNYCLLRGMDTLVREATLLKLFYLLYEGVYTNRKEFPPRFFLFRIDLFQKGLFVQEGKQEIMKVVSCTKW